MQWEREKPLEYQKPSAAGYSKRNRDTAGHAMRNRSTPVMQRESGQWVMQCETETPWVMKKHNRSTVGHAKSN
jgi:hypothetical protein